MSNTLQKKLDDLLKIFTSKVFVLSSNLELEIRFGTKGKTHITKLDYNNVIQRLISRGFVLDSDDQYLLRIQNEYFDQRSGTNKMSIVRCELSGLSAVQTYCKTNRPPDNAEFYKKSYYKDDHNTYYPVDFNKFNFRVSLQDEVKMTKRTHIVTKMLDTWGENKKTFRLINRVSFVHPMFPVKVDMSIVKTSKRKDRFYIPEFTIQESGTFNNQESYEIEIEFLNKKLKKEDFALLEQTIHKLSKYVLSGLQESNYPISNIEMEEVLNDYMKLIHGPKYNNERNIRPRDFIGYSSVTLQNQNIREPVDEDLTPNINNHYTVTDKADGLRKLCFINKTGKIYFIDSNMNVQFTGENSKNKDLTNTLLDGEHILHGKKKEYINTYMIFDIYFLHNRDVRDKLLLPIVEEDKPKEEGRYELFNYVVKNIQMTNKSSVFSIKSKTFHSSNDAQTIFGACNNILKKKTMVYFHTKQMV